MINKFWNLEEYSYLDPTDPYKPYGAATVLPNVQ